MLSPDTNMSQYSTKPTTTVVCLYRPPLSESPTIVVPSGTDGKVDVGAVSRAFGLNPSTVKLKSHYLSLGPDLVSRFVTRAALLLYFVLKGLPVGRDSEGGAVVVEGKPLLRMGSKSKDPFVLALLLDPLSFDGLFELLQEAVKKEQELMRAGLFCQGR